MSSRSSRVADSRVADAAPPVVRPPVARLLAPLTSRVTYLRTAHLLVGGALLLPFFLLDTAASTQLLPRAADFPSLTGILALFLLGCVIVLPPVVAAITTPTRAFEVAAAGALLDVGPLGDPIGGNRSWEDRWRMVVWFALHLALGGVAGAAVLIGLPVAADLLAAPFGGLPFLEPGPLGIHPAVGWARVWRPPLGVVAVLGVGYLLPVLGVIQSRLAPTLLGPSPAERVAELERQAERLAERNRLARELHDSVGHALTVTTLQAAAAQRVLEANPEFARSALAAIEAAGRAALTDLDHVLGLLRESSPGPGAAPQPTLHELRPLLDKTRGAGVEVLADITGALDTVPAAVSREAYRIVQEGLTNALRYAGKVPVTVRLAVLADELELELANPIDGSTNPSGARDSLRQRESGGRGLRGIRERVAVLHGRMEAGITGPATESDPPGDTWRLAVRIPLRPGPRQRPGRGGTERGTTR